jgi:hypothetical protein
MISKGVLTFSKEVYFNNQKAIVSFTPTFANAPETKVVCFFLDANGNVVSTSMEINLSDKLPNYVS